MAEYVAHGIAAVEHPEMAPEREYWVRGWGNGQVELVRVGPFKSRDHVEQAMVALCAHPRYQRIEVVTGGSLRARKQDQAAEWKYEITDHTSGYFENLKLEPGDVIRIRNSRDPEFRISDKDWDDFERARIALGLDKQYLSEGDGWWYFRLESRT